MLDKKFHKLLYWVINNQKLSVTILFLFLFLISLIAPPGGSGGGFNCGGDNGGVSGGSGGAGDVVHQDTTVSH